MRQGKSLHEIAKYLELIYEGGELFIEGINSLKDAKSNELSFLHDSRYLDQLKSTRAGAVLVEERYLEYVPEGCIALVTSHPYLKLAEVSKLFAYHPKAVECKPSCGSGCSIAPSARFGEGVKLGENVTIMSGVYLGDGVHVGSGSIIYPNVTIYHGCQIGNGCIIHSGTVIGSDGYGFAHTDTSEHVKIYHTGNVVIEDLVEIGANCTIDRAVFGATRIGRGTKIDNLIQIAHNCTVGKHVLMASQVGVSGSTTIGDYVVMGGQSGTAGHLSIGDKATIMARGGVTKSLDGGKAYGGFPAVELRLWKKMQAVMMRLIKSKT